MNPYKKYDIESQTIFIPPPFAPYFLYTNRRPVPKDHDFYPTMREEIKEISIRIFQDRFLNNPTKFQLQISSVIVKTENEKYAIGLHLFPTARLNKKNLPSKINFYVKESDKNKISINLPTPIPENLLKLLNQGKPQNSFTYLQVINFLNGVYSTEDVDLQSQLSHYICLPIENPLTPGSCIVLGNKHCTLYQAAIYIGQNLYLWSTFCSLRISSFDELISGHGITYQMQLVKKEVFENLKINTVIDLQSKTFFYPKPFISYVLGNFLPSLNESFYPGLTSIEKISIRVFSDHFLNLINLQTKIQYQVNMAYVRAKIKYVTYKIGLHLFPVGRFNLKEFPLKINFHIKDRNGNKFPINLPAHMLELLLNFLNTGRPDNKFTCYQFVNYLNGVYQVKRKIGYSDLNEYDFSTFNQNIVPGDAIAFKKNNEFVHAAIYLGYDIYLWHSGTSSLIISSLESIKQCYESTEILKMHIKLSHSSNAQIRLFYQNLFLP